jgi:hypothetical protein
VKELVKRDADIRMLVRKEGPPNRKGIEVRIGDLLDPVSVGKAMDSVDKLYLLNAVVPDKLAQGLIAYDLAKRLKLKHIVYHSVYAVDRFKDVPHFASKLAIENAIREFDLPFTIIRPNYFFQNDVTMVGFRSWNDVPGLPRTRFRRGSRRLRDADATVGACAPPIRRFCQRDRRALDCMNERETECRYQ